MHAHYFQHVPFEGLGSIEPWLREAGYTISRTAFFEAPELPEPDNLDLLIVMGGPMGVNDEDEYPWLAAEKAFIRQAIEAGKPVLGICLGAQLIAAALGARVYQNPCREIGWMPVRGIPGTASPVFKFPSPMQVFQWHGDTFELPEGAVRLARSDACENQAFQFGTSVLALQFHLEMTPGGVADLVRECGDSLEPGPHVQTAGDMLGPSADPYGDMHRQMARVLSFLHGQRVHIREAAPEDARAMLDYMEEVSGETDFLLRGPGEAGFTEDEERKFIADALENPRSLLLVAEIDGRIVASLGFFAQKWSRIAHSGEFGMAVRRECWGLGIGSRLVDRLLDWARQGGEISKINLQVRVDNERAVALYLRKGFRMEGRIANAMRIDDQFFDFYHMGIVLSWDRSGSGSLP